MQAEIKDDYIQRLHDRMKHASGACGGLRHTAAMTDK